MALLRADMPLRVLLSLAPQVRELFVSQGEDGDREVFGVLETLESFARRRGLSSRSLILEVSSRTGLEIDSGPGREWPIHKEFLGVALLFGLSLGVPWGAKLLFDLSPETRLSSLPVEAVLSHGASQLWGFLALFVLGVALRFVVGWSREPAPALWSHRLALLAITLGVIFHVTWAMSSGHPVYASALSGFLTVLGTVLLCSLIWRRRPEKPQLWFNFVVFSGLILMAWSGVFASSQILAGPSGPSALVPELRALSVDLGVLGFALCAVYGFGLKLLPGFLSTGRLKGEGAARAMTFQGLGLASLVAGRLFNIRVAIPVGIGLILTAAVLYLRHLNWLRGREVLVRKEFGPACIPTAIRLAFAWLIVALSALFVLEGLRSLEIGLPRELFGAARHALTVGFLLTLKIAVGLRLLPIFQHRLLALSILAPWIIFFVATGNLLRVLGQSLSPFVPAVNSWLGLSAVLELAALSGFAISIGLTLSGRSRIRYADINEDVAVMALLESRPDFEEVLIRLGSLFLREVRQLPGELTLGTMARLDGADVEEWILVLKSRWKEGMKP